MIRTKIIESKTTKKNTVVWVEERYNETGINQGLFFVEEMMGKRIQDVEMFNLCTALDILKNA